MAKNKTQDTNASAGIWETREWKQTAKTTPDALQGAKLQTRVLRLTSDPAEALRRGLVAAGAPEDVTVSVDGLPDEMAETVAHAIIDGLNDQGIALNRQKRLNTAKTGYFATAEEPSVDEAQEIMDAEPALTPKERRVGGPSVKKEREAKGRRLDEAVQSGELDADTVAKLKELGLA